MSEKVVKMDNYKCIDAESLHKPLVSIIITHHNFTAYVEGALRSIISQCYENWECVVVDDRSLFSEDTLLKEIVYGLGDKRIKLLMLDKNVGQISAFFAGLDQTTGDFVCLLDPDDRYENSFLEKMVEAHLNKVVYCPIACCEQKMFTSNGVVTGIYGSKNFCRSRKIEDDVWLIEDLPDRITFIEASKNGWHWTSTSSMMFRRSALTLVRPNKPLAYKGSADSYLAQGLHMLGGTIHFSAPLVYRMLHEDNAYLTNQIYAMKQCKRKTYGEERTKECRDDVIEAIAANGGPEIDLRRQAPRRRSIPAMWRRSFAKRWNRVFIRHQITID